MGTSAYTDLSSSILKILGLFFFCYFIILSSERNFFSASTFLCFLAFIFVLFTHLELKLFFRSYEGVPTPVAFVENVALSPLNYLSTFVKYQLIV